MPIELNMIEIAELGEPNFEPNGLRSLRLRLTFKEPFLDVETIVAERLSHPEMATHLNFAADDRIDIQLIFGSDQDSQTIYREGIRSFLRLEGGDRWLRSVNGVDRCRWKYAVTVLEHSGFLGRDDTPLITAVKARDFKIVEEFLRAGCDPSMSNPTGSTALMYAAAEALDDAIELLIDSGASVNERGKEASLLQFACHGGHRIVSRLLALGAPVDATNIYGETALYHAVLRNDLLVARELVAAGADPFVRNCEGKSPISLAAGSNRDDLIAIMNETGRES